MKVILYQDVPKVGQKDEVKDVSDGYARNFLFPRKLAGPATEESLKTLNLRKAGEERGKSAEYQKYKSLVDKLKLLTLILKVKIGTKGRAFGSVTPVKIRDELKKHGVEIEKEWILIDGPIKETGEKSVDIKFPLDLKSSVKLRIEAE